MDRNDYQEWPRIEPKNKDDDNGKIWWRIEGRGDGHTYGAWKAWTDEEALAVMGKDAGGEELEMENWLVYPLLENPSGDWDMCDDEESASHFESGHS